MSIRHLDSFFDPRSVAVLGASDRVGTLGHTVWQNLLKGGYGGARFALNPKYQNIGEARCYADLAQLPEVPELAILCTPVATVPALITQLGALGTRAAIVLSAGFDAASRAAMLKAASSHLLRVLGPNCIGMLSPPVQLNASFAHAQALPGELAFVAQSGALLTAMLDWARGQGIGFSRLVSLGEQADVDVADLLDWLASDAKTRSILLYVESISNARKFMSAARAAARNKPVLIVKSGRSEAGRAAAASHTGAMAGADAVFDAAIARAGMLRVDTLEDLFVAAETLTHFVGPLSLPVSVASQRLTIITNGGGAGVMAADEAERAGVALAPLQPGTLAALDAILPATWSRANPVDIIGDAPIARYVQTFQALLADDSAGTLLLLQAPTAIVPSRDIATALLPCVATQRGRMLSSWLGGPAVVDARKVFRDAGIASYHTPEAAVAAFALLQRYRHNQLQLLQTPPALGAHQRVDAVAVRAVIDRVLREGRQWLDEVEAKALLVAAGIAVVDTRVVAASASAAVAAAAQIGYPVVLKILSPQITHKSDVGGVQLGLADASAVAAAAALVLQRVATLRPDATVSGFTIQAMVQRSQAQELIIGSTLDPVFGPVILFGAGGTAVEALADRALALPPLNPVLAQALIARTRIARLLAGWRDVAAADQAAIIGALMALSELLALMPEIVELDINPLLASATGVVALDARVRVDAAAPGGADRFAIKPYPDALVEQLQWRGRPLVLRPIRPEDEAQHRKFLEQLDPVDIRMRVFYSRRSIEHSELARLTQIDYSREMAFIATALGASGEETLGVVRATVDPKNVAAEFGIVVRSDLKGSGLGEILLRKLIGYQRACGTQRLVATVLSENARMLELAAALGFVTDCDQPEADTVNISRVL